MYVTQPGIHYLYGVIPVVVSLKKDCDTCYSFKFHDLWTAKCSIANSIFCKLMAEDPYYVEEFNSSHTVLSNLTKEQIAMLKELKP